MSESYNLLYIDNLPVFPLWSRGLASGLLEVGGMLAAWTCILPSMWESIQYDWIISLWNGTSSIESGLKFWQPDYLKSVFTVMVLMAKTSETGNCNSCCCWSWSLQHSLLGEPALFSQPPEKELTKKKGFLYSDREEMKRGSSSHGEQVLLEASKRQIPWTGYWNWKGIFQCLPEAPFGCVAQIACTSAFLLFSYMEWVEPEEPTEQVGRKVHRASALPLMSLKGPVVEETEDASRKTEVVCWLLPDQCWRTALLPERVTVCASAFQLPLETQTRLAGMLSMHRGRSL